jgi:hypothetical protein
MEDQVERITAPQDGEIIPSDDGLSPRMPFPTSYRLTREQEDELVTHAMKRLEELEAETGRNVTANGEWWRQDGTTQLDPAEMEGIRKHGRTWMGKRHLYDLMAQNDVEHRSSLLGGIFAHSNLVVPIARRICRQMIARAVNYFFGTDPWFAVYPVGEMDKIRAEKADKYLRWKTDGSKLKGTNELAVQRSFEIGEAVVKSTWREKSQIFKTKATVLIGNDGNPILGQDGDFITERDLWVQSMVEDPDTGEPVLGPIVLKRDNATPEPEVKNWQERDITRRLVHYRGTESNVIHYTDFLCPLEAENVQDADCVVHLYDQPLMGLADEWAKSIPPDASAEVRQDMTRRSINLLRELDASPGEFRSGQNSNAVDSDLEQANLLNQQSAPQVEIAEFYLRYDCDGDGILEEIMLVLDRNTRTPIYYDYVANVTPDGLRPFSVIRCNRVPNRWYGFGAMEMFESSQQIVDLLVNRWNFGNSRAARIDFWSPHNTLEGRNNSNLEVNWGGTYTPGPGKKAADCLESVYLENNTGPMLRELTEFFMQLMMNESGVSNANDGNVAGLDTTKLATGIRNIEKSGQELFSLHIGHLEPGIASTLKREVDLIMVRLDEGEVYRYFEEGEGGEGAAGFMAIDPAEIMNIEVDTRILLTRYRGEQMLESSIRGVELVEKFYGMFPEVQQRTAPMFQDMLNALQINNARSIIQPMAMLPVGPGGMPNAQQTAQAAAGKPRTSPPNI